MWFKITDNDKEMIKLLKKSGSNFRFDPKTVKYRLLSSIETTGQKPVRHFHFHLGRVAQYSVTFAGLVLIISATFAFASTAQPGDKLFALNKWGEQVVLNLPLSLEQKAKVQEYIVTNRLEALDEVVLKVEAKKLETLKESDETLQTAVNEILKNKKQLEDSGKSEAADRLEKVLDNLQAKAEKREAKIKELEDKTTDEQTRLKIQNYRLQLKSTREKARAQIKRYQNLQNPAQGQN